MIRKKISRFDCAKVQYYFDIAKKFVKKFVKILSKNTCKSRYFPNIL